ncbi:hypothetical protein MMC20_002414 [Loxospora ochrophaea]|nr:hypothetical protein [Loxospora ochrophaea]
MLGELSLLSFATRIFAAPVAPTSNRNPLRFSAAGTFQLSIFEDLHYGEGTAAHIDCSYKQSNTLPDFLQAKTPPGVPSMHLLPDFEIPPSNTNPRQDIQSTGVMNTVLDAESPQLVVLNGDLITGENTFLDNSTAYISQIVAPLVQRSLPWASTYGNHDENYNLSTAAILATEAAYPLSYTQNMLNTSNPATSGVSNYYLPIYPSTGDPATTAPSALLWFFDSRGGLYYQQLDSAGNTIQQPGWVDQSVVDWFLATQASLAATYPSTPPIPSLAFVHIPTFASAAFQSAGVSPTHEPGINDDNPLAMQSIQNNTYTGHDIPFMQALLDTKGLIAVFSGHDHGDDWCAKWTGALPGMNLTGNGLDLCFGRHSGYGGYGNWSRGSRQVWLDLDLPGQVETWVRLETGEVSGSVVLNGSYGMDVYPPVADTYT